MTIKPNVHKIILDGSWNKPYVLYYKNYFITLEGISCDNWYLDVEKVVMDHFVRST